MFITTPELGKVEYDLAKLTRRHKELRQLVPMLYAYLLKCLFGCTQRSGTFSYLLLTDETSRML